MTGFPPLPARRLSFTPLVEKLLLVFLGPPALAPILGS